MTDRGYLSPRESYELWRWARDEWAALERRHGLDPDPPRCWSCGHPFDAGCECAHPDCDSAEPGPGDA